MSRFYGVCSRKEQNFCLIICILICFHLFHYFCYQWLYNLAPSVWGREFKCEYDTITSLLCSYACYSLQANHLVSRPPCRSDTLNSFPHNKCNFPKNSASKWIKQCKCAPVFTDLRHIRIPYFLRVHYFVKQCN